MATDPSGPITLHSTLHSVSELRTEDSSATTAVVNTYEQQWQSVVELLTEGVVLVGQNGCVTYSNRSAERLLDVSSGGLTGIPVNESLGKKLPASHPSLWNAPRGTHWLQPDGRVVSVVEHASQTPDDDMYVLLLLTEMSDAETISARADQQRRAGSLGTFVNVIAHDFNIVLQCVSSVQSLLELHIDSSSSRDPEVSSLVTALRQSVDHGSRLTRRLLEYSVGDDDAVGTTDVARVLHNLEEFLRRLIGSEVGLVIDVGDSPVEVSLPVTHLEEVIVNLTANASQAIADTGTITIGAHARDESQDVELTVTDTGRGMSTELRSRIFDSFFTTRRHRDGWGVGLNTVAQIVDSAGGSVRVGDGPNGGTTFHLYLPR